METNSMNTEKSLANLTTSEIENNKMVELPDKNNTDLFSDKNWDHTKRTSQMSSVPLTFMEHLKKFWHPVITYCAVFWSFGMCVAFLGPTILDLGCMTGSDMKSMSWVFFAQLLCSLLGASLAGYLVQRCTANYILLVASFLIPAAMFVIPFCRVLPALAVVLAIMGLNMGIIDCLANLQMIKLFGDAVPPFLQALHFCYGLGAFVSPMIAEPFLLNEDCSPFVDNGTDSHDGLIEPSIEQIQNDTSIPAHSLEEAQNMTRVRYAFWIMAAIQLPIPILVASLVIRLRLRGWHSGHEQLVDSDSSPSITPQETENKSEYGSIVKPKSTFDTAEAAPALSGVQRCLHSRKCQIIVITMCTALMLFIYDGLQSAYGGYVYSYAVKSIADLNKTEGAYLNALFWGTFALGRLISIPLATRFSPVFMLLCNIGGCLFSMTLMLALRHDHIALYIGTSLYGIFLSSVAPTAISLAEQYIDLTSTITSVIVVMGAVGEMICPVVVGNIFVVLGPVSFLAFAEILCLVSIVDFIFFWLMGRLTPKHIARGYSSFIWGRMCCIRQPPVPDDVHVTHHVKYRHHQQTSEDSGSNIELDSVHKEIGDKLRDS